MIVNVKALMEAAGTGSFMKWFFWVTNALVLLCVPLIYLNINDEAMFRLLGMVVLGGIGLEFFAIMAMAIKVLTKNWRPRQ